MVQVEGIRDQGSGFRVRVEVEGKVRARVRHEVCSMIGSGMRRTQ